MKHFIVTLVFGKDVREFDVLAKNVTEAQHLAYTAVFRKGRNKNLPNEPLTLMMIS